MELVRYAFSDLTVRVYHNVGIGIHHPKKVDKSYVRGVCTNENYRQYQNEAYGKLGLNIDNSEISEKK